MVDWNFTFFTLTEITATSHGGLYAHMWQGLYAAGVHYTCTCPWFHKRLYCKHSYGYAVHTKREPYPNCCKQVCAELCCAVHGCYCECDGCCCAWMC